MYAQVQEIWLKMKEKSNKSSFFEQNRRFMTILFMKSSRTMSLLSKMGLLYFWSWLVLFLWRQTWRQLSEIWGNDDDPHIKVQFRKNAINFEQIGFKANNCQTKCICRNEHRFVPSGHHFAWRGGVEDLDHPVLCYFLHLTSHLAT